jgi:hypothetical protein
MTADELKSRIRTLAKQVYQAKTVTPLEAIEYDELTKFPELKQILVTLMTPEFSNFLSSIDWVAPRPTTFRIVLANDQVFYLIFTDRTWIGKVEGKKYYLLNLSEEQNCTEAIARILSYGTKVVAEVPTEVPSPETSPETPAPEEPSAETPPT